MATTSGNVLGPFRGIYVPHGWIATPKSESYITTSVKDLAANRFNHQIHNIGKLGSTGRVPASDYSGLARWSSVSRTVAPEQRILGWISGSEATHVNKTWLHGSIASWVSEFVSTTGVDGVVLDIEPFARDNPNYLRLMNTVRAKNPRVWIGVNTPATKWTNSFITSVAKPVDALMPMLYDTGLTSPAAYTDYVAKNVLRYASSSSGYAQVYPVLAAYKANSWGHDPAVENITTGLNGVGRVLAQGTPVAGAAVYWWWEMTAADKTAWAKA